MACVFEKSCEQRATHDSGVASYGHEHRIAEDARQMAVRAQLTTRPSAVWEVFAAFIRLGVSSFGGPVAHLGYFRAEFVVRRRWVDERTYADLVALCQFLPGPASSQTGFALGLMRGGYLGGIAAWAGFTLPSAMLLVLFAFGAASIAELPGGVGLLHGLGLVAVAIVAQAVWGMARSFCADQVRASVATAAACIALLTPTSIGQLGAILLGGVVGLRLCKQPDEPMLPARFGAPVSQRAGIGFLTLFGGLLLLQWGSQVGPLVALFNAFYRSGALVFGGGHVVLPLLRDAVVVPGWVSDQAFVAGYGAAQAVPGPLFTFAAYLGAIAQPVHLGAGARVGGAVLALVAIFLPGLLLLMGVLPFWDVIRTRDWAQSALRGVNAAVVGVLGAALYDPVWTSAIRTGFDFALALVGFVLLVAWRAPPILVVGLGALCGMASGLLS
jgi:chromate transporter